MSGYARSMQISQFTNKHFHQSDFSYVCCWFRHADWETNCSVANKSAFPAIDSRDPFRLTAHHETQFLYSETLEPRSFKVEWNDRFSRSLTAVSERRSKPIAVTFRFHWKQNHSYIGKQLRENRQRIIQNRCNKECVAAWLQSSMRIYPGLQVHLKERK